tara:strand:+ start:212 stop:532 length:321 start_codon:yes stop_codon:yes gene_type:complete
MSCGFLDESKALAAFSDMDIVFLAAVRVRGAKEAYTIKDLVSVALDVLHLAVSMTYDPEKPATIPYRVFDPAKAKELMGWEARVSLQDGLMQTIDWYQKHIGRCQI